MMKKSIPAANPDAYVSALTGWRRPCVEALRAAVRAAAKLEEVVKWGHLVYLSNGPVLLIRAEEHRVLFGFWRGQRLQEIENKLKPSGLYEMATLVFVDGMTVDSETASLLTRKAVALNKSLGNPTDAAKSKSVGKSKPSKRKQVAKPKRVVKSRKTAKKRRAARAT